MIKTETGIEESRRLKAVLKSIIDEIGDHAIMTGSISFDRKTNLGPLGHEKLSSILEIKFNATIDLEETTAGKG